MAKRVQPSIVSVIQTTEMYTPKNVGCFIFSINSQRCFDAKIESDLESMESPMQLIKRELSTILHSPPLKPGDAQVFEGFVLAVASPQSCGDARHSGRSY